jgi:hypothetical protein
MDVSFWLYFAKWLHLQDLLLILEGEWERGQESLRDRLSPLSQPVAAAVARQRFLFDTCGHVSGHGRIR